MDITRIFDTLKYQKEKFPNNSSIVHKDETKWHHFSTSKTSEYVNNVSYNLLKKGLQKSDTACILSKSGSAYWMISDLALQQIGVVVVPLHTSYSIEEIEQIIELAEVKYFFGDNTDILGKLKKRKPHLLLCSFNPNQGFTCFNDLMENSVDDMSQLEEIKDSILPSDLATIIFTSGSTGHPKGVMLSHSNLVSNLKSLLYINPFGSNMIAASFLPLSHIFERMTLYTYLASGVSIRFISDATKLFEEVREIRPHIMTAVPRIIEKAYEFIDNQIEEKGFIGKKITSWAVNQGMNARFSIRTDFLAWLKIIIADFLVYRRWRLALGGRLRRIVVGAAAMDSELSRLFSCAGVEIREGYGLTETSPAVSFNRFEPGGNQFGTVGIPIPGVEVKIKDPDEESEGEILVRGPNVMMGYYKNPKLTKERIDKDGWFHTGDVGKLVDKKFLKITDRKKNIFKTSSGKYVAPQVIEMMLRANSFVSQCMVIGFQKPFVSALILPSFSRLKKWCEEEDIHWTSEQFMVLNPMIHQHFQVIIDDINNNLKSHERIQRFTLLHEEWSIYSGEYSTTLKLKRETIVKNYEKTIEKMYAAKKR